MERRVHRPRDRQSSEIRAFVLSPGRSHRGPNRSEARSMSPREHRGEGTTLLQLSNQDLGSAIGLRSRSYLHRGRLVCGAERGPHRVNADGSPIWSDELSRDDGPCGRGWYAYKESSEPEADGTTLSTPYLVFVGFGSGVTQTDRDALLAAFSSLTLASFDRLRPPAEASPS